MAVVVWGLGTVYALWVGKTNHMQGIKKSTRIKAALGITLGVIAGIVVGWVISSILWGIVVGFVAALTLSTLFSFKKDTPNPPNGGKGGSSELRPPI